MRLGSRELGTSTVFVPFQIIDPVLRDSSWLGFQCRPAFSLSNLNIGSFEQAHYFAFHSIVDNNLTLVSQALATTNTIL